MTDRRNQFLWDNLLALIIFHCYALIVGGVLAQVGTFFEIGWLMTMGQFLPFYNAYFLWHIIRIFQWHMGRLSFYHKMTTTLRLLSEDRRHPLFMLQRSHMMKEIKFIASVAVPEFQVYDHRIQRKYMEMTLKGIYAVDPDRFRRFRRQTEQDSLDLIDVIYREEFNIPIPRALRKCLDGIHRRAASQYSDYCDTTKPRGSRQFIDRDWWFQPLDTTAMETQNLEMIVNPILNMTGWSKEMKEGKEFLVKLAEDSILFLFLLWRAYRAKDKQGLVLAIIVFLKLRCGTSSLTSTVIDKTIKGLGHLIDTDNSEKIEVEDTTGIFDRLYQLRGKWYYPNGAEAPPRVIDLGQRSGYVLPANRIDFGAMEAQGLFENITLDSLDGKNVEFRRFLENFEVFSKTPCYKKLYNSYMYLLAFGIFSKMGLEMDALGYDRLAQERMRSTYGSKASAMFTFVDTASFLFGRGIQIMKTGSLDPIYHSGNSYDKWFVEAHYLLQKSKFLNNAKALEISEAELLGRLNSCIEQGQAIFVKIRDLNKNTAKYVHSTLDQLLCAQVDLLTSATCLETREVPFSLLIVGDSSIGKTTLTDILFKYFGKLKGLPTDDMYKHTRNPGSQFWDNFKTYMWFIRMDDIAFMNPNKAPQGDPSLMELLQIINAVPFTPNQADLKDKGRTPCRPKLVIATTNTKLLNCHQYFSCPSAVQRRMPFVITPVLKKKYSKDNSLFVRQGEATHIPDYWNFTVEKVSPPRNSQDSSTNAVYEILTTKKGVYMKNVSMRDLLLWMQEAVEEHDRKNGLIAESNANVDNAELCEKCKLFPSFCSCKRFVKKDEVYGRKVVPPCETNAVTETFEQYVENVTPIGSSEREEKERNAMFVSEVESRDYQVAARPRHEEVIEDESVDIDFAYMECQSNEVVDYVVYKVGLFFCLYQLYLLLLSFLKTFVVYCIVTSIRTRYRNAKHSLVEYVWNKYDSLMGIVTVRDSRRRLRQSLRELGDRFQRQNGIPVFAIAALSVLGTAGLGVYLMTLLAKTSPELEAQGNATSIGCAPTARRQERKNVWYKESFQTTKFDLPPAIGSLKHATLEQLVDKFERNLVALEIKVTYADGMVTRSSPRAVGVGGFWYLTNSHNFPYGAIQYDVKMKHQKEEGGVTENVKFTLKPEEIKRIPERDIAFFQTTTCSPKAKLIDYFCKASFEGKGHGAYMSRTQDGAGVELQKTNYLHLQNVEFQPEVAHPRFNMKSWVGVSSQTAPGFCGAMLVGSFASGPMILGIHSMGDKTPKDVASIVAARVTREDIEAAITEDPFYFDVNVPDMRAESGQVIEVQPLHFMSPLRWIESGTAAVYGSINKGRSTMKSKVVDTPMAPILREEFGIQKKFFAPNFSKDSWMPWRRALLDNTGIVDKLDSGILNKCVEHYVKDVTSKLTPEDFDSLHVYDLFTAVNGAAGIAYVDPVKKNTSAGFPWNKSKKYLIKEKIPTTDLPEAFVFNDDVMQRVDDILEHYKKGKRACPIFTAHLKDEAVKMSKILIGKYRVFSGASLPFTLVERMYLLSFIRVMQNNRLTFESAPGTNAMSPEWEEYYKFLTAFGEDKIVAGDYRAFDKTMASKVILACFRVIIMIATKGRYTQEEVKIIAGIAIDIAFAYTNFNGDLVEFFGSNPSGHALTVIINCIAGCLYIRYAYYVLNPKHELDSFQDNVHLVVYGDDNIMGISDNVPWFNHTSISKVLAEVGIEYTMADKEAESQPYIHISEATFLKRSWRYCEEIGMHVCPIEVSSIEKSLMTWIRSDITEEEHMLSVLSGAWREASYHGEQFHKKYAKMINRIMDEFNLRETSYYNKNAFPSWLTLMEQFRDGTSYYTSVEDNAAE